MSRRSNLKAKLRRASGLRRFVAAQNAHVGERTAYEQALAEIRDGWKMSNWMDFVFPQLEDSEAEVYGLTGREAEKYVHHRVLGPRLKEAVDAVLEQLQHGRLLVDLLGHRDARKFVTSLELFSHFDEHYTDRQQALATLITVNVQVRNRRAKERKWG